MTVERWQIIRELFWRCLEEPPEARESLLASSTTSPDIVDEVREMLRHHESASPQFLSSPTVVRALRDPHPGIETGDVIAGRFEIVRLLGQGGVGEVYEALDRDVGELVALKALQSMFQSDPEATSRFRRELQLSRRISHPNVCRVFDLVRHTSPDGDRFFISMELISGVTLAAQLKTQGPYTAASAAPIVDQILDGLGAAHREGVIHRDLKPSNIMLSGDRVVLMDFGLAGSNQMISGSPADLTSTGRVMGTLDYMAPEQLQGRRASEKSDIYSVGLILYEMLTGRKPFPGDVEGGVLRRLTQLPEPLANVPQPWSAAIMSCLEVEPDARPSSTVDVRNGLAGSRVGLKRRRVWPRPVSRFLGAGLLLALLLVGLRFLLWEPSVPSGSGVLLAPVENLTGDPRLDGVTTLMREQIQQSSHLSVLQEAEVRSTLATMRRPPDTRIDNLLAREVALRRRVPLVVFGNLTRLGTDYSLTMKVEVVGDKPALTRNQWNRVFVVSNRTSIPSSLQEAARWIRGMAGEAKTSIAQLDRPADQTTTSSWEALEAFDKAGKLVSSGQPDLALSSLTQAVRLDPDFALAEMQMGDLLSTLRRETEADPHYRRAIELAGSGHLTRREELLLKGNYYSDRGDYPAAEQVLREFVQEYPNEYRASFLLGSVYRRRGRLQESIDEFWRAERKRPQSANILGNLAMSYLITGQYDQVDRVAARIETAGGKEVGLYHRAAADFLRGRAGAAIQAFTSLTQSSDPDLRSRSFSRWAQALAETNRLEAAEQILRRGIQHDAAANDFGHRTEKQLALAFLRFRAGDRASARVLSLDAVSGDPSVRQLSKSGSILAWAGFTGEAQQVLDRLRRSQDSPKIHEAILLVSGEIDLAKSRFREAIDQFEELDRIEAPLYHRLYLARAYRISGDRARAAERCRIAQKSPGLFWHFADYELPTLLSYTCSSIEEIQPTKKKE